MVGGLIAVVLDRDLPVDLVALAAIDGVREADLARGNVLTNLGEAHVRLFDQ